MILKHIILLKQLINYIVAQKSIQNKLIIMPNRLNYDWYSKN